MNGPSVELCRRYSIVVDLPLARPPRRVSQRYCLFDCSRLPPPAAGSDSDLPFPTLLLTRICHHCADGSACDHHFLIEAAEERFLADADAVAGEPLGDFVTPQIEREGFQFGQQRSPNVAQRMPPSRQIVIHNNDLSAWLHDPTKLAERLLAILAGCSCNKK